MRIGFVLGSTDPGWMGGVNYFRNLFGIVTRFAGGELRPILFAGHKMDLAKIYGNIPLIERVQSNCLDRGHPNWLIRKTWHRLSGQDTILGRLLRKNGIHLLSHSAPLGNRATLPSIGWIPDFQHTRLPDFFTLREIKQRDKYYSRICRGSARIIVSSAAAQQDLACFSPSAVTRSRILRFVVDPAIPRNLPAKQDLAKRYSMDENYFLLPNQFWAHKNHLIVVQALKILKSSGRRVCVIATGNTVDFRQPGFFDFLVNKAKESDVLDRFKVLGVVPYEDLIALMIHSVALINPSLFEGWSTTVEEAKSLGKIIILSDLPVHREQAPEGGIFFHPKDAAALARILWRELTERDERRREALQCSARGQLPGRFQVFAQAYRSILEEVRDESSAAAPNTRGEQNATVTPSTGS